MKHFALSALALISLTAAAGAALAADGAQHHHDHDAAVALQLNAGKKWETDDALRQNMGAIRRTMATSLHAIHENHLSAKAYGGLARKVENAVGGIVANCKLGGKADEQLHLVIADLIAGADAMAGKAKAGKARDGALKVLGAMDNYGKYFDDPGFKPIAH